MHARASERWQDGNGGATEKDGNGHVPTNRIGQLILRLPSSLLVFSNSWNEAIYDNQV